MSRRFFLGLGLFLCACSQVIAQGPKDAEFRLCDESKLYRVDDPMLAAKGLDSLPIAAVAPKPRGTADDLQRFFDEKVTLGPEAADLFVRVHIGFVVNCHGRLGEVRVLSPAAPEIGAAIAGVVEKLPEWEPGTAAGTPVDTLTKLSFTVSQGRAKVSLK